MKKDKRFLISASSTELKKYGRLTRIDRWARVATESKEATAESAESEPWPNWDAPGRKGYDVVVVVVAELLAVVVDDDDVVD